MSSLKERPKNKIPLYKWAPLTQSLFIINVVRGFLLSKVHNPKHEHLYNNKKKQD